MKSSDTDIRGGSLPKRINCVISRGRASAMGILNLDESPQEGGPYIRFRASGLLHYTEGACVFGIVSPDRTEGRRLQEQPNNALPADAKNRAAEALRWERRAV
jgi:hypothetical protein